MVRAASQGGHPPGLRRLRVRGGRDADPGVRRHGGVRQVQQRPVRAPGQQVGVEEAQAQDAQERAGAVSQARPQFGCQPHPALVW